MIKNKAERLATIENRAKEIERQRNAYLLFDSIIEKKGLIKCEKKEVNFI